MMEKNKRIIVDVPINKITTPAFRARINFNKNKLEELEISINDNGLIHPIRVKTVRGGYEIVAGERRFMCCQNLKWKTIPCEVGKGTMLENEMLKVHENLKREDLTDIEEAHFLKRLLKLTNDKPKQLAVKLGKSEAYVKQKLKILTYPDYLYNALAERLITFSSARELVRINDDIILRQYVGFAVDSGITPTIAKQWADEFIKRQEISKNKEEKFEVNINPDGTQIPYFLCQNCGVAMKVEETQLYRMCIDINACEEEKRKNND